MKNYDINIPVLSLSKSPSLLNGVTTIPYNPVTTIKYPDISDNNEILNGIRYYLSIIPMLNYSIPKELEKEIQDIYVNKRKEGGVKEDDLNLWLCLSRFECISHGKNELRIEDFKFVISLEDERRKRNLEVFNYK